MPLWAVLIDDAIVELVDGDADSALCRARDIRANVRHYADDDLGNPFAIFSIAKTGPTGIDRGTIVHLPPADSVPDALVPREYKQLR